jgi:hypothetical protein
MPQQELDLFEIAAVLAAELGAGAAEVVGAEALDPDLLIIRPARPGARDPLKIIVFGPNGGKWTGSWP